MNTDSENALRNRLDPSSRNSLQSTRRFAEGNSGDHSGLCGLLHCKHLKSACAERNSEAQLAPSTSSVRVAGSGGFADGPDSGDARSPDLRSLPDQTDQRRVKPSFSRSNRPAEFTLPGPCAKPPDPATHVTWPDTAILRAESSPPDMLIVILVAAIPCCALCGEFFSELSGCCYEPDPQSRGKVISPRSPQWASVHSLGVSWSTFRSPTLFVPWSRRWRIYRRTSASLL